MHAPQIILLVWWAIGLGASVHKAVQAKAGVGEPIARVIIWAITAALLGWGGFWSQP